MIFPGHHGDPQTPNPASLLWALHGNWSGSCHLIPFTLQINPSTGMDLNPSVGLISSQYGIDLNFCSNIETALNLGTFGGIYGFRKDKAAGQPTGCILQSNPGGWLRCSRCPGRGELAHFEDFGIDKSDNESWRNPGMCCPAPFPARQRLLASCSSKIFSMSIFPPSFGNQNGLRVFAWEGLN